jgi:hypothetical protein
MKNRSLGWIVAVGCISSFVGSSYALPVTPTSYTFVPGTKQGTYSYIDETGNQLTDGLYGPSRLWSQADAVPYLGWLAPMVTLNFNFAEATTFESVTVSALQAWLGNIVLPDVFLYASNDGVSWTPVANLVTPETSANNYAKANLTLDGLNVTAQYLQIELRRNVLGPWIFTDEVTFNSLDPLEGQSTTPATTVPEAGTTLALLGIGISSLALFRKRNS